uniref:Myb-like domain-containing protein n=1 Tax=Oryza punctata TaxID=4537 RepID=A0A0E0KL97_ORYPU
MGDLVGNDGAAPPAAASAAEPTPAGRWTRQKDKLLETLVARHAMHRRCVGGWDAIAAALGDRTTAAHAAGTAVRGDSRGGEAPHGGAGALGCGRACSSSYSRRVAGGAGEACSGGVSPPSIDGGKEKRVVEKKSGLWSEEEHRVHPLKDTDTNHQSFPEVFSRDMMAKPKEDRKRKSIHDTPYHLHLAVADDDHAHQQQAPDSSW